KVKELSIKSLQLSGTLHDVVGTIEKGGIKIISIKGPVLAQTLFGDLGKRHFGDLDLVVRREDVLKVVAILERQGYKMISPKSGLTKEQWDYYFSYKKDVGLVNREKRVFIELHVGVYRHELLRIADEGVMWEDLEEVMIGGTAIKTMNRANTFLYLLYHGGQHLYFRLFWLRDVAEAMKRWDLEHQKILDMSLAMGIDRMVGLGVLLANELFDVAIPNEYDQYLQRHKRILGKLKRMCLMKIFGPENDTFVWKLRRYRYNLMLKSGLKYKWAVISSLYHRWYIRKFLGGH
ncbi:MAG: nucleotidyltransferase family protein, partial [Bacteroidetes bacterium]|nr:nucleotidyltransferase family protein [Bacteroidota bacterium]